MRNRFIAGLAASALVSGALAAPILAAPAFAALEAPVVAAASVTGKPLEVTSFGATIGYDPAFVATQNNSTVTLKQAAFGAIAGPPAFVRVNSVKVDAVFDVNGSDVAATGASGAGFVAGPLANGFVQPDLKLTLPAGTSAGDVTLKSYKVTLDTGSPTVLDFTVAEPVKVAVAAVKPLEVTSFGATIGHDPAFVATQNNSTVTLKQAAFGAIAGPPAFVRVNSVKVDAVFDVNGSDVAATGASGAGFVAGPLANGFVQPDLKLTLPAGTSAGDVTLKSYKVTLDTGSPTVLDFTVVGPVKVAVAAVKPLEVTSFGATIGHDPAFVATQDGAVVTLKQAAFGAIAGPPAFVRVNSVKVDAVFDVNGTDVAATGASGADFVAGPLANGFVQPDLKLTLPGGTAAGDITLKSYKVTLDTGSPTVLDFTVVGPVKVAHAAVAATATTTTGTATTPAANTVKFDLSVSPEAAGTFEVREGDKLVASQAAVAGKATITLTGVAKGAHSYSVTFVSSSSEFANSVGSVGPIDVADKPVVDPPVVKVVSKSTVTKVTYSKKTKKAKVSVKVTGKNGTATGKATIIIKQGKKTVAKKVVTLKKGKATWTSKKITRKGTYKVTVKYAGSKSYKASTSKAKTFKIKK